jgi:hypothetical protein
MEYRGYIIKYDPKPIPDRGFDWDYYHEDYDGAPDSGDRRCGAVATMADAKDMIDELIEDEEE